MLLCFSKMREAVELGTHRQERPQPVIFAGLFTGH